jgi:hypothetical protein
MASEKLNNLIQQLDSIEQAWINSTGKVETSVWKEVSAIVKDLDVDKAGNIRKNVANLKRLGRIRAAVKNSLFNTTYEKALSSLDNSIAEVTATHTEYFESISGNEALRMTFVNEMEKQAKKAITQQMGKNGLINDVSNQIADMIENDVRAGRSFAELQDNVKTIIRGNEKQSGRLAAHSYQIVTDSLNQYAASLNEQFSEQLGLDWYEYVGGTIKTTRPFCKALYRKRYVHRSEFGAVAAGRINGTQVSKAGMIVPTTASNLTIVRGGYNCRHQLYAIPTARVPKRLRDKFNG